MPDSLESRLYKAFDPAPLTADRTDLYVELDNVRGDGDIVNRMSKKIRLADVQPTCQVLAGHKGSGKSTELYRLKRKLEQDEKMFVVFCKADEDIDRNDVDFPDLLVAIIRQIARQLRESAGILLKPGYFKDRLQQLGKLLTSDIDFDKFDIETGLGKLGVTIKGSPDARMAIRKIMEPDTGNMLNAANDVISDAVLQLVTKGQRGLVVLVDDLDKMVLRARHDGCPSDEYLFVRRAAQLTAFKCHVVYSMPISLAYSRHENAIKNSYGGHVPVVPMTKIMTRPPDPKPSEAGIGKFRDIVRRRLESAVASQNDLFVDDSVRDQLIRFSGGQPSELMTLVREAIVSQGLPVAEASLKRAEREGRREYERQLRAEHWPIIEQVRSTGKVERTSDDEPLFRELLESRAILQYVNDDEFYGLNPAVAAIKRPDKPVDHK